MISIHMFKLWKLDLSISKRGILKYDIKFSNVILGSENINFNGLQIFDAKMHYRFHHKSYNHQVRIIVRKALNLVNRDDQKSFKKYLRRIYESE